MKLLVELDEELGREFRAALIKKYGAKRGLLKRGIEEAVRLWLEKNR